MATAEPVAGTSIPSLLPSLALVDLQKEKCLVDADLALIEIREKTDSLVVVTFDQVEILMSSLSVAKRLEKLLLERRKEKTEPLKTKAKAIEADFNKFIQPITEIKEKLDRRVIAWHEEQERKAAAIKAEQERLQREAEEKRQREEDERKRLAAEAHAREVEEAAKKGIAAPPEPLIIEHDTPVQETLSIPTPEVKTHFTTATGSLGIRKVWKAEVTDLKALCKAIGEGTAPVQAVEANMSFLNRQAAAFAGQLTYAGVTCKQVAGTSSR